MCGIVGYVGNKEAVGILIEGLTKLEYRGYDSAGISVVSDSGLVTVKEKGHVLELVRSIDGGMIEGHIGIGHTRWATHGEPNKINAHPHLDCHREIAVVHNGIVENYQPLRQLLKSEGHRFVSETDSEVFSHLIEKFYQGEDLELAVQHALRLVEGAYGLAVISRRDQRLIAARRGSPLLVGIGHGEMFVASDAAAIRSRTDRILYLEDNEIASLTPRSWEVKNTEGDVVDKQIEEIKWTVEEIEKGRHRFFMEKEIYGQPQALEDTLRGHITEDGRIKLTVNVNPEATRRIVIVGCGTSWHVGLIGKHYLEQLTGIPVEVDYASEFRYRSLAIDKSDLVIAISQSGETADTLAAIREAKERKALTLGIVNVVGSSISREVESGIYTHAGPEVGVASTKAFSCQTINLLLLGLYMRQLQGKSLDQSLLADLKELPEKVREALALDTQVQSLAAQWKDVRNALYLGRGINFPVALEGALKLKEISYIHAEGYPAAEMKHGPIALIDDEMPVVFIVGNNGMYEKILSNMEEVKARGGRIMAVYSQEDERLDRLATWKMKVPKVRDEFAPVVNNIPLQLLALNIADLRGIDVDRPRNLAKSVTVE